MKALIDQYTKEEFGQIIIQSHSLREVAQKLGYQAYSGDLAQRIKKRIELENIDISHFSHQTPVKRTVENIFIENSTADQKTVRKWYLNGEYSKYQCSICNLLPEWNGMELTLILDHINGNNKDDRLENLRWVCPNCNQQLATTGSRNPNRKTEVKKYFCVDCGKEISKGAERCVSCNALLQTIPLEEMPVTREELKNLIRTKPFTQIGQQFHMTDNAVRKWCDKFGLPRTKTHISSYSDEEWKLV